MGQPLTFGAIGLPFGASGIHPRPSHRADLDSEESVTDEVEVKSKGGRPAKDTPPQTIAEVRSLMSKELVC
jgi:hypothetical protein